MLNDELSRSNSSNANVFIQTHKPNANTFILSHPPIKYRTANEGLVGVYIDQLKKNGVILEVNCETDFVAKNNKFKELVSKLTKDFATVPQVEERRVNNSIQKYVLSADRIPAENEHISEAVTHLGEKIRIKRACFIKNHYDDPSISLVGYAHSTEGLNNHLGDVTFGKYATIVALKQLPNDSSYVNETAEAATASESGAGESSAEDPDEIAEPLDFDTAAKQICQHIIVAAPERVRRDPAEQTRSEANEKRTESAEEETGESQAAQLPKQPAVLVEQEFLHSDYERVDDFLRFNNLEVVDFIRIKCGESSD